MTSNVKAVLKYRAKNRDKYNAYMRDWNAKHPDSVRHHKLMSSYGIGLADYNRMYDEQNGVCILCNEEQIAPNHTKHLFVEHNHVTGKIRGLVCTHCNRLISRIENKIGLEKLNEYLKE